MKNSGKTRPFSAQKNPRWIGREREEKEFHLSLRCFSYRSTLQVQRSLKIVSFYVFDDSSEFFMIARLFD